MNWRKRKKRERQIVESLSCSGKGEGFYATLIFQHSRAHSGSSLLVANSIFFIQRNGGNFPTVTASNHFEEAEADRFVFQMTNRQIFFNGFFFPTFAENTGKLQIHHVQVPDPFILGSSSDLFCNYSWTGGERESRPIYSIKWYKESAEFFRWVCQWHQKHKCHVQKMLTHLTTTAVAGSS